MKLERESGPVVSTEPTEQGGPTGIGSVVNVRCGEALWWERITSDPSPFLPKVPSSTLITHWTRTVDCDDVPTLLGGPNSPTLP